MDIVGHVLLGVVVSGPETSPATVAMSLLPDVGALPLQYKGMWRKPPPWALYWYKLCHSPLALLGAYFLPEPGFLLVATHIVSDMFTHERPYSDFPVYQWSYNSDWYAYLLFTLGATAWLRLFY